MIACKCKGSQQLAYRWPEWQGQLGEDLSSFSLFVVIWFVGTVIDHQSESSIVLQENKNKKTRAKTAKPTREVPETALSSEEKSMQTLIDGASYGRLLLKPERPFLAETWTVATEDADLREAWERLAARGVIPSEWLERGPAMAQPDGSISYLPSTVDEVIAFASDAKGIHNCIHLGQELGRALSAWNICDPSVEIQWIVRPRNSWTARHLHPLVRLHATTSMPRASLFDRVRLDFIGAAHSCASAWQVADLLRFAALWKATAMFGREQPGYSAALAPVGMEKTTFEQWPDPWGPWLAILALGYAVDCYERTRITLVAPQYTGGAPVSFVKRR